MTQRERLIVSAYTGVLMCDFGLVHKYIEEKMGHPVWTHELGFESTHAKIREKVKPDFIELCGNGDKHEAAAKRERQALLRSPRSWQECVERAKKEYDDSTDTETIADIVAEMRKYSQDKYRLSAEWGGEKGNPGMFYLQMAQAARVFADRIEAAAKRAYNDIDSVVCGIEDASHYDIDDVRKAMEKTIGDYYE